MPRKLLFVAEKSGQNNIRNNMKLATIQHALGFKCRLVSTFFVTASLVVAQMSSSISTKLVLPEASGMTCTAGVQSSSELQAELIAGRRLVVELEPHVILIEDSHITGYLNRLEEQLFLNSDLGGCFVVKLVKDVEANAYSLPGGFLYVTSGLILGVSDESGLVAALAHETGHVTARHLTKIEHKKKVGRNLSFVGGPLGYLFWREVGPLLAVKSLRSAEFEADRLALRYQSASGYDPQGLARLLNDEFSQEGKPASYFARLFDEHPSTQARIARVEEVMKQSAASQINYVVDTSEFHEVKNKVAALMGIANPELQTK